MAQPARRRPEAVRELEELQQAERAAAGEPALTIEAFAKILREDVHQRLISDRLASAGMAAVIAEAAELDAQADVEAAALLRHWHVNDPDQWSRFETPAARWAIANTCARVEEVFARRGWLLPDLPVVGTLTTGHVSAVTQRTQSGAPIVLIDNGFFRFTGTIGQLAVLTYDARFRARFARATLQLVCDLVVLQTVLRTCLYLHHRPTPDEARAEVDAFQDSAMLFVLGHEYAHVAAGHLDAHPAAPATGDDTLRAREFAADRDGFIVCMEATRAGMPAGAGAAGPFLYFCGLDLIARAEAAYRGTRPVTETRSPDRYPTPFERTVQLLDWIDASPELAPARAAAHDAAARYNTILFVWDRIHPVFAARRYELAQYDPARRGNAPVLPEAVTTGLVMTLWQAVVGAGLAD